MDPQEPLHSCLRAALPGARPPPGGQVRQRRAVRQSERHLQSLQTLSVVAPPRHRHRAHQAWPPAAERPPRAPASPPKEQSTPPPGNKQPAATGPLRRLCTGIQSRTATRGARHEVSGRTLLCEFATLLRPARPHIPAARPRRPRHRLRPHLHASQARQHLNRARRSAPRHQGGRRRHLDRQFQALRSRLHRSRTENPATPRQPLRHRVVTHVLGTFRYLCLRYGTWTHRWSKQDSNPWSRQSPKAIWFSAKGKRGRVTWTTRRGPETVSTHSGTDGSNPSPSSGESRANLTSSKPGTESPRKGRHRLIGKRCTAGVSTPARHAPNPALRIWENLDVLFAFRCASSARGRAGSVAGW